MTNETHEFDETHKPRGCKDRPKRGKWFAAVVAAGLALIAGACRHDGSAGLTTGVTSVLEAGGRAAAEGPGEHGGSGEGSEAGGEHGQGGEGSEGSGHAEAGEETSPSTPIDQVATGNFNSLDYTIGYDPATRAFTGTVQNNTAQTVCAARVEVHMSADGQVTELGPTPGADLAPGETLDVVLPAGPVTPDTFAAHAESSSCEASTAPQGPSGEVGGEHGDGGGPEGGGEHGGEGSEG